MENNEKEEIIIILENLKENQLNFQNSSTIIKQNSVQTTKTYIPIIFRETAEKEVIAIMHMVINNWGTCPISKKQNYV